MQVALLRVLQEGSSNDSAARRRGSVDVRVIAATTSHARDRSRPSALQSGFVLSPQRLSDPPAAAARSGGGHSRHWWNHFLRRHRAKDRPAASSASIPRRSNGCRRSAGPATSASSRTSSNRAPSSATNRCSRSGVARRRTALDAAGHVTARRGVERERAADDRGGARERLEGASPARRARPRGSACRPRRSSRRSAGYNIDKLRYRLPRT